MKMNIKITNAQKDTTVNKSGLSDWLAQEATMDNKDTPVEIVSIDEERSKTEIKDGKLVMTIFAELKYEYAVKFSPQSGP